MRYLLFVEKHGPYDHDLTLGDFVKDFDDADEAMNYYDAEHSGWPYEEPCGVEDCRIEIHPASKQRVHHHGNNSYLIGSRPHAFVASWDGKGFEILFRRKGWSSLEKSYKDDWCFGDDHEEMLKIEERWNTMEPLNI